MKYTLIFILFFAFLLKGEAQSTIWKRHVIDASFSGADGVRLADVNNDNLTDIATGWEEGGFAKVYVHPGYELVLLSGKLEGINGCLFLI